MAGNLLAISGLANTALVMSRATLAPIMALDPSMLPAAAFDNRQRPLRPHVNGAVAVLPLMGVITQRPSVLDFLFGGGGPPLSCLDAGDTNDNGSVDVADVVYLLAFLFSSGDPPPPPFPDPGPDPTPDPLVCP